MRGTFYPRWSILTEALQDKYVKYSVRIPDTRILESALFIELFIYRADVSSCLALI